MNQATERTEQHCLACVYHPPNLPRLAYPAEDYRMLQEKACSFDFMPGDPHCQETRKTSCSLVDLKHLEQSTTITETGS